MKKIIVCMKDMLTSFLNPFLVMNVEEAKRAFSMAMTSNDMMMTNPKDYTLYALGEMDMDTGVITPYPVIDVIMSGDQFYKEEN